MATTVIKRSRPDIRYGIRLFPALIAGAAGAVVLLVAYYLTLGLLPTASSWPATEQPVSAWAHRFDIAQFLGTIPLPPLPTPLTWWVGLAIWFGTLVSCGVVYAVLLSWTFQPSDPAKGAGLGIGLALLLLFGFTLAQGFHPAIMRNALPDTGLLMLGWSIWAPVQLLFVYILYGATVGAVYKRLTVPA